jgi:hypothetical protein
MVHPFCGLGAGEPHRSVRTMEESWVLGSGGVDGGEQRIWPVKQRFHLAASSLGLNGEVESS